jgi:hypothetical protein
MNTKKRKPSLKILILFFLLLIAFGKPLSQEALDWVGSYSSRELEAVDEVEDNKKIYYYWQIQSLKRVVSPRYIRLLDISEYSLNGSFLRKGVLFTYNGLSNAEVEVCGNFSSWKCIPMTRNRYGIFFKLIPTDLFGRNEERIQKFEYKFRIDGIFDYDPSNPNREEDGKGSFFSTYTIEKQDFEKNITYKIIDREIDEDLDFKTVEFQIYNPNASTIALVGDFNQWNPEHDYLSKKKNGVFSLRKKLRPGTYLYYYIVDGKPSLDIFNHETRYRAETEELCSYIFISDKKEFDHIAREY